MISKKFKLKRSSSLAGHDTCPSLPHELAISKKYNYVYIFWQFSSHKSHHGSYITAFVLNWRVMVDILSVNILGSAIWKTKLIVVVIQQYGLLSNLVYKRK